MQRTAGDLRTWYLLALFAQAGATYAPLAWMLHVLSMWNVIQSPGFEFLQPGAYATILAGVLLLPALLGLALGKAWGWSWSVMIDTGALCLLALGVISRSLPPFWPSFFFVAAGAVMITPGVRAFYSRPKRPWPMRWWACEREGRAEFLVRTIIGGSQVLFSVGLTVILLPSMYPLGLLFLLLFGAIGIIAGRKLYTDNRVGFYLTIAWCAFGVWVSAGSWRDLATRYPPVRGATFYLYFAACFLLMGVCASATLARNIAYQRRLDRSGRALDNE